MWAELTYEPETQTWDFPIKRVIKARALTDAKGVQHPQSIFLIWSPAELAAIGFMPFREMSFDSANRKSSEAIDAIVGDEVVRSHKTVFKSVPDIKAIKKAAVKALRDAMP